MKRFRFRAQAALDLRTRELERAQRELARAEGLRDAARGRLQDAAAAAEQARAQATEAQRTASDAATLQWYRFWILRLDYERAALEATLKLRAHDVAEAAAACMRAKQRRESLERFRQKAQAAHDAALQDAERKVVDELATRRFVTRSA